MKRCLQALVPNSLFFLFVFFLPTTQLDSCIFIAHHPNLQLNLLLVLFALRKHSIYLLQTLILSYPSFPSCLTYLLHLSVSSSATAASHLQLANNANILWRFSGNCIATSSALDFGSFPITLEVCAFSVAKSARSLPCWRCFSCAVCSTPDAPRPTAFF